MNKTIIFALTLSVINAALAECPSGYASRLTGDYVFAENGAECPAGYSEISSGGILPAPETGGDSKGTFEYGACVYN
jgi:hypothetical protein